MLPKNVKEIKGIVNICKSKGIPLFIMGNGSNLLVRDKGIRGVVIKIAKNFSHVDIISDRIVARCV